MKRISLFLLIQLFLVSSFSFGQFGLGKLKKVLDKVRDVSELDLSEEDEIALGKEISKRVRETFGVQQDAEATRYVTLVGSLIVEESGRPNLPYQFIILDTGSINAFAAPGGFIHITRGALGLIRNESELAGVLAHEVGHVTAKHSLDELKKTKGIKLASDQTSLSENSEVLQQVADKMTEALLKGFGRKQELEADSLGVAVAAKVGYDPTGLPNFLDSLSRANEGNDERKGLFASHPETKERIEKLEKQIAQDNLKNGPNAILEARYQSAIKYKYDPAEVAEVAAGVKGVAGSGGGDGEKKDDTDEPKKKGGLFSLAKLSNPLGSGEKKQTAEVTSSGGTKGVGGGKAKAEGGPKNPALVEVKVSKADLEKFRSEGGLKKG